MYTSICLTQSADLCWLIRTGDWIRQNGSVPQTDLFNWYLPERVVISYQWLFEVCISFLHTQIGLWGIGLISNICAAFFLFWMLPRTWLRMSVPFSIVFMFCALLDSRYWHFPRPQLISTFYLYFLLALLEKFGTEKKLNQLCFLPPLILLWSNTHPSFTLGLVLTAIYFAAIGFRNPQQGAVLFLLLIFCCSLVFVNPFGSQMLTHTWSFINGSQYLRIYETLPAYQTPDLMPFWIYVVIAAGLVLFGRKQLRVEQILTAMLSLALGMAVNRFEPFAVIGSWQSVGIVLASFLNKRIQTLHLAGSSLFCHWQGVVVPILIGAVLWWSTATNEIEAFHLLVGQPKILQLPFQRNKQRLFNDPEIGSWLIYLQLGKPFVDNRFDTLPRSSIVALSDFLSAKPTWREYITEHSFDSILISDYTPLFRALAQSSSWVCLADDGRISYWEKESGQRKRNVQ